MKEEKQYFSLLEHNWDLKATTDQWRRNTYEEERRKITDAIFHRTQRVPAHNIIYAKELVIPIKKTSTMQQLMDIADYIRRYADYDTFQITIDHEAEQAHLLMDNYDYTSGRCIRSNYAKIRYVQAYAIQKLGLTVQFCEGDRRYYLVNVFRRDKERFDEAKKMVTSKDFPPKVKNLIMDCITYARGMCEGVCK